MDNAPTYTPRFRFKVLASGSSGNASVLITFLPATRTQPARRHVTLIDAGLSPKLLNKSLKHAGLNFRDIDDLLLTHLDRDHAHHRVITSDKLRARVHIHHRHMGRAEREGLLTRPILPFEETVDLIADRPGDLTADPLLLDHDQLGVAVFRIQARPLHRAVGFATDLGRATPELHDHLRGVDLLAIESNYCPELQAESDRPDFLKRRIMNGAGHLSNQEAHDTTRAVAPREHVVLLHRSRQCNTPERAAELHHRAGYALTLAEQYDATPWIEVLAANAPAPAAAKPAPRIVMRQPLLFGPRA
ncbi:MAG: MBL fold metallo-hydrolase [Planctomycetota bacterium]